MTRKQRQPPKPTIPKSIMGTADTMYRFLLSGQVCEGRRLRRNLIRYIRRELDRNPENVRLWCMLGDLYTFQKRRMDCCRQALRTDPSDAEANAEIARLYAAERDRRYALHFDRALRHCRGADIEESIIYSALEAARAAQDQKRIQRALKLGRRRFPDSSSLFHP